MQSRQRTPAPDVACRVFPVGQRPAFLNAFHDALCDFRYFVFRIFLNDLFQRDQEAVPFSAVQLAHGLYEHEFSAVCPLREIRSRNGIIAEHFLIFVLAVSFVCGGIQRILYVLALPCVKLVFGVGQHDGIPAVRELLDEPLFILFRLGHVIQSAVDKE